MDCRRMLDQIFIKFIFNNMDLNPRNQNPPRRLAQQVIRRLPDTLLISAEEVKPSCVVSLFCFTQQLPQIRRKLLIRSVSDNALCLKSIPPMFFS